MGALFPAWSNTAIRASLFALILGAVGVPAVFMIYVRTPYARAQLYAVDQPVEFDHRHHVLDDGIDCRYCHTTVERAASAGYPSTALCMGCHAQIWTDSLLLEPVRRSFFTGVPLGWNRVHRLPDFVFFDHSIHVKQGIECQTCHGQVERMARVAQLAPLTMSWCLQCHRAPERFVATKDARRLTHCSTCHR